MFNSQQQKPLPTSWHSLLWKEWHEHKWKLAMLVLLVLAGAVTFWPRTPTMLPVVVGTTLFCYSIFGIFLGMSTAAGENGRGTLPFLRSLPISMRKAAAIKLGLSWVTLVIPVLIVVGFASLYLRWHATDAVALAARPDWIPLGGPLSTWGWQNWLLALGWSGILASSSLLAWTAATGANRADEIRAGAVSFLAMTSVWLCLGMLAYWAAKWKLPSLEQSVGVLMAAAPAGAAISESGPAGEWKRLLPSVVVVATVVHACLVATYLRRFGRDATRPARTCGGVGANQADSLAPPRGSRVTAIVWQQLHDTGPLALLAAGAVVAITSVAFWLSGESQYRSSYAEIMSTIALSVGFLVTIVTGMGLFLEDVKPKVSLFWRSRPVNTAEWFFAKYLTGLVVLVLTFGALLGLACLLQEGAPLLKPEYAVRQVTIMGLLFLQLYTLSVASYCLCRQPVVAAVGAIGVFFLGFYAAFHVAAIIPIPFQLHTAAVVFLLLLEQGLSLTTAWLAIRNDWGWHQ